MAIKGFHNLVKISADAEGNAPKTIELLRAGKWNTPWHGDFEITPEDIQQYVLNASNGVGLVEADPKVPVNYGHASYDKAAGWMPRVYASDDGQALLGDVDWTPAAEKAIKDGEWKYISPEFNPSSYPWEDPEEEFHFVKNVITGAALTNIPLFKKLKPIQASRLPNQKVKADAIGTSDNKEGDNMTLEEIRAKEVAELTDEEKSFLAEHKTELSTEELEKYSLKEAEKPAAEEQEEKPEQKQVEASAIKGITAEELAQLRADAEAGREAKRELEETKARTFVQASIETGRLKSDQLDGTVKLLLASKGEQRTQLEAFINGLPENKLITADELGSGKGGEETKVELSKEEETLASDFGNTPEELAKFKEESK
ncbi:phage I-like protein [Pseudarthrobacter oxydans]|uniref:Phage I-like protein n=1 Tax=Pseudarthrobacter oxydans TaxID=1671 RepID=A0AAW8NH56_PSEOX|nr:phage protease [Pseudarthrobacter oxydans]MDR6794728.1 phage I-like protein [Pseudarthrobacter oxydans]MDR7166070.1 phage I-like protein [Pseudarthrobacter oxydans]